MQASEHRLRYSAAIEAPGLDRRGLVVLPAEQPRTAIPRLWRAFEFSLTMLLSLAALPFGLLIALAIVLDSRGPVFFAQTRVGRGRKPFRLWKFRSMSVDADRNLQALLRSDPERAREWALTRKLRNDPRITRVGRFLRRTSLDELPQFWNVLRGDMSLVGPRPIVSAEIPKYGSALSVYAQALPGVTGLWQVSGRNDTHYNRRVELDCHYIRNRTAAMDLRILLKTVRVMILGRGAY
ncbi:MAG TPA: sugar transferase [Bryobacteraceae bacterium]|nr:sugar transferase [Bryobacteraceae bacterium]